MERRQFDELVQRVFHETEGNHVMVERADGTSRTFQMFDEPLVGIGSADDPLFLDYKETWAVGPWHRAPKEWLPEARTVVSLFFPVSEEARKSNRTEPRTPSLEWLYCRIEGNEFLRAFIARLRDCLREEGYLTCAPAVDERFKAFMNQKPDIGPAMAVSGLGSGPDGFGAAADSPKLKECGSVSEVYGSMWSERHVAYLCGLGTFGLSKGIITRKGMAGRFASLVTALELTADERPYKGLYDYCIRCGRCIERCPVHAISEEGKEHKPCHEWLLHVKKEYAPRLGCGKCQTAVPCESRIPGDV